MSWKTPVLFEETSTQSGKRASSAPDVPSWSKGDWWEFDIVMNNTWPETGEYLDLAGTIKYRVDRVEYFSVSENSRYLAYNLTISGEAAGNALYNGKDCIINGDRFSNTSSLKADLFGHRILRVSDMALLREVTKLEGFVHYDSIGLKFLLTEEVSDRETIDIMDFPLVPDEEHDFSTAQNRSFELRLTEMGTILKEYSDTFPFSYSMLASGPIPLNVPAGEFDAYNISGRSGNSSDPSTMNYSYCPEVKFNIKEDLYRIIVSEDELSVVDSTRKLTDHSISENVNTVETNLDRALPGIPLTVSGNFPEHPFAEIDISFPFTGEKVEASTDGNGDFSAMVTTPEVPDNTPSDISFGITAWVKDDIDEIATKSIVIVSEDNVFPMARAGPDGTIDEGTLFRFNGSGSRDDMAIKNHTWTFAHNNSDIRLYGPRPSFRFEIPGKYEVLLAVTDFGNNIALDNIEIKVNDITPPVAAIRGKAITDEGTSVNFDGGDSYDPEGGGIAIYNWTFKAEGKRHTKYGRYATFLFENPGKYDIILTVTDKAGNEAFETFKIKVRDITPPVGNAGGNVTVDQYQTVRFNGSDSTDNVGITVYNWTFTYDGEEIELFGKKPWFKFDLAGIFVVTLNVTDDEGNRDEDSVVVRVRDITEPMAEAGNDTTIFQHQTFQFDGTGSHDNVGIVNWTWSFTHGGEIVELDGPRAEFEFEIPGIYPATLGVTDAEGNRDEDTLYLTVREDVQVEVGEGEVRDAEVRDERGRVNGKIRVSGRGNLSVRRMDWNDAREQAGDVPAGLRDLGIVLDISLDEIDWIHIEIPYEESDLPEGVDENGLRLYFWNETSGEWEIIEDSSVDTVANVVSANVTHLTLFAPLSREAGVGGEDGTETGVVVLITLVILVSVILNLVLLTLLLRRRGSVEDDAGVKVIRTREEAEEEEEDGEEEEEYETDMAEFGGWLDEFYCPTCGEVVQEDDTVCSACGVTLKEEWIEFDVEDLETEEDEGASWTEWAVEEEEEAGFLEYEEYFGEEGETEGAEDGFEVMEEVFQEEAAATEEGEMLPESEDEEEPDLGEEISLEEAIDGLELTEEPYPKEAADELDPGEKPYPEEDEGELDSGEKPYPEEDEGELDLGEKPYPEDGVGELDLTGELSLEEEEDLIAEEVDRYLRETGETEEFEDEIGDMDVLKPVIVCPDCGTENDEKALLCLECRADLEDVETVESEHGRYVEAEEEFDFEIDLSRYEWEE